MTAAAATTTILTILLSISLITSDARSCRPVAGTAETRLDGLVLRLLCEGKSAVDRSRREPRAIVERRGGEDDKLQLLRRLAKLAVEERTAMRRNDDDDDGGAREASSTAMQQPARKSAKTAKNDSNDVGDGRSRANSRQHKAFFVDYPVVQRVYTEKSVRPTPTPALGSRKKLNKQKQQQKKKKKQPPKDSEIFYIRLPPAPYSYVPGLGYISQPPTFSASSLLGGSFGVKPKPPAPQPPKNPFIKLPTKFVSNGKPVGVYSWKDKHHHLNELDSPIIRLNRGPYVFDGRPSKIYVLPRDERRRT